MPVVSDAAARAADLVNPLEQDPSSAARVEAEPVNKLHEWAAAIALMLLLSGVLFFLISFLRGTSL